MLTHEQKQYENSYLVCKIDNFSTANQLTVQYISNKTGCKFYISNGLNYPLELLNLVYHHQWLAPGAQYLKHGECLGTTKQNLSTEFKQMFTKCPKYLKEFYSTLTETYKFVDDTSC